MRRVKRLFVFVALLWFGTLAAFAQAHVVAEELHALTHAQPQHHQPQADAGHADDLCGTLHCCHAAGPLPAPRISLAQTVPSARPWVAAGTAGRSPPHEIERPKWAAATPVVASL